MIRRVSIVEQHGSFRLIECLLHGYAVVEARGGQVYSIDGPARRQSEDSEVGMIDVVGTEGWRNLDAARARFDRLVLTGVRFAEKIW